MAEDQPGESQYDADLRQAAKSNMDAFDRAVVTLSSGTLALTVSFLGDVVKTDPSRPWLALFGWLCLSGAGLSTVFSHLVADRAYESAEDDDADGIDRWNNRVKRMNWLSGLLLVAGQTGLAFFAYFNL